MHTHSFSLDAKFGNVTTWRKHNSIENKFKICVTFVYKTSLPRSLMTIF